MALSLPPAKLNILCYLGPSHPGLSFPRLGLPTSGSYSQFLKDKNIKNFFVKSLSK